jgi:hypothetical protein
VGVDGRGRGGERLARIDQVGIARRQQPVAVVVDQGLPVAGDLGVTA